jgi:hypothetical protein
LDLPLIAQIVMRIGGPKCQRHEDGRQGNGQHPPYRRGPEAEGDQNRLQSLEYFQTLKGHQTFAPLSGPEAQGFRKAISLLWR